VSVFPTIPPPGGMSDHGVDAMVARSTPLRQGSASGSGAWKIVAGPERRFQAPERDGPGPHGSSGPGWTAAVEAGTHQGDNEPGSAAALFLGRGGLDSTGCAPGTAGGYPIAPCGLEAGGTPVRARPTIQRRAIPHILRLRGRSSRPASSGIVIVLPLGRGPPTPHQGRPPAGAPAAFGHTEDVGCGASRRSGGHSCGRPGRWAPPFRRIKTSTRWVGEIVAGIVSGPSLSGPHSQPGAEGTPCSPKACSPLPGRLIPRWGCCSSCSHRDGAGTNRLIRGGPGATTAADRQPTMAIVVPFCWGRRGQWVMFPCWARRRAGSCRSPGHRARR